MPPLSALIGFSGIDVLLGHLGEPVGLLLTMGILGNLLELF